MQTDQFRGKNSDDILKQINAVSSQLEKGGGEEMEVESYPSVQEGQPERDETEIYVDSIENDENLKRQWQADGMAHVRDHISRTGTPPEKLPTFEEWKETREFAQPQIDRQRQFTQAVSTDIEDFLERYPLTGHRTIKKLRRGEIEITPDIVDQDDALKFLHENSWGEAEFRRLSRAEQEEIIRGAKTISRTRSLDVAVPGRIRPSGRRK